MGVSKVEFDGETVIDITDSTVTPETLAAGIKAYDAAGNIITGVLESSAALVSDKWDVDQSYTYGEYRIDENELYRCLIPNSGQKPSVSPVYWEKTTVANELNRPDVFSVSGAADVPHGNSVAVYSEQLSPGIYIVEGAVEFPNNTTGYRTVTLDKSLSLSPNASVTVGASTSSKTRLSKVRLLAITTPTTIMLSAQQTSNSTLACPYSFSYIKLR